MTLRDVADAAGVSVMTVSNVINGRHARVSAGTIDRVRRIVVERGYVPSASARSLAARSSRLIGLLVNATDEDSLTISPHNTAIFGQIERQLRKRDYHLILRGIANPAEITEALTSWSLDGAVLLGFVDEEIDRLDSPAVDAVPLLAIDSYSANPRTTGVRSDDRAGAYLAAAHLLGLGHRHIVFAGPGFTEVGVVHERFLGFCDAFDERGLNWHDSLIEAVPTTHDDGVAFGRGLLDLHPTATAVFATADILAIGIMEGLADVGVSVPGRVSVVGFDDLDISAFVTPKLTTVAQDIVAKAGTAVDRLLDVIDGADRPAEPLVLDVRLVERGSTAPVSAAAAT